MTLAETVDKVIALAREVCEYYERELPNWHPDYPLVHPDEGEPPAPPAEGELRQLLEGSSERVIARLLSIMHLGQKRFDVDEMVGDQPASPAGEQWREQAVALLLSNASLGDHLADGLEELSRRGMPVGV